MHPDIEKRWNGVEERRVALVKRVEGLSGPDQITRPKAGSFSPAEMIMHMALAERWNVGMMKKSPPPSLKGRKVKHGIFWDKTLETMRHPSGEVRTMPQMTPKGQVHLKDAEKAWEDVRKEMRVYFAQCETPDSPMLKHMFLIGTLSASDYLDLLEAHLHYHEVRFPSSGI
ncbi:MAG TPA: hypothetical protein VG944_18320 [Fimbriimonas sp.]|nr:hypothetical protein [Fimbriimonas sp.]